MTVDRRHQHPRAAAERYSAAYGSGRCTQHFWAFRHRIERALVTAAASAACSVHIWSLSPAASTWCCRCRERGQAGEDRSLSDYAHDEPVTRWERSASLLLVMLCSRDDSAALFRAAMLSTGPCFPGCAHGRCMVVPVSCQHMPLQPCREPQLTWAPHPVEVASWCEGWLV